MGVAGRTIRDAANMEVYRKYMELYTNFQISSRDFNNKISKRAVRDFKGVVNPSYALVPVVEIRNHL